jgi:excisionase family DNA binding protein
LCWAREEEKTVEAHFYTPQEVAKLLRLQVQTVYDYIRMGRLPAVRFGNRYRIAQADLDSFVAGSTVHAGPGEIETAPPEHSEKAIQLLDEWMADDSGYDEETWPELKAALDRDRLSSRKLFDE